VELCDAHRSGWPTTAAIQVLLHHDDKFIPNELSVSKESVNNNTDASAYSKVCAHCVPQSLTNYQKAVCKHTCSDLLSCYKADGESFFHKLSLGMKRRSTTLSCRQKGSQ
jgi:hypothetical protein